MHSLKPHQLNAIRQAEPILAQFGFCYIFGMPRVGKSLIAHTIAPNALVITKKGAIEGWLQYKPKHLITNYEQVHKLNPKDYADIVIIDESHNLGTRGKPSLRVKRMREFCKDKRVIFLSGTPCIETPLALYHQLCVTRYSPFTQFKNFYAFFRHFGEPHTIFIKGRTLEQYDRAKPSLLQSFDKYCVKVSYEDAKISPKELPSDRVITIEAPLPFIERYNAIKRHKCFNNEILENPAIALHQYEGGTLLGANDLQNPKLLWLMRVINKALAKNSAFSCAIMCYFVAEQRLLADIFKATKYKNIHIYSYSRYCEGMDLSAYEGFILYSFGYSGAKFTQARARVLNIAKTRAKGASIIIPLIQNCIGAEVYKAVSKKRNFNIGLYKNARVLD